MEKFLKFKRLRKQGVFVIVGILLLLVLGGMMAIPKEPLIQLRIGVIRGEKSEEEYGAIADTLHTYLTTSYGEIDISLHYYDEDEKLVHALEENIVHLAFVSGIGEALYGSDEEAVIAAENVFEFNGEVYPYYTAVFLKREYEGYDEFLKEEIPSALQYCILPSNSLAGYVFVVPHFEDYKLYLKDMDNVLRIKDYAQGIEYLANGTCDVSVGYLGILEDYADLWLELEGTSRDIKEDLRVIYVSDKIYSSAVLISEEIQSRKDLKELIIAHLLENNYSESNFENYQILKERIETILGGKSYE